MFEAGLAELKAFDPSAALSRPELADALDAHDKIIALAEANRLLVLAAIDGLDDNGSDAERMGRNQSRRSSRKSKKDAKTASALKDMPTVAQKLAMAKSRPNTPRKRPMRRRGPRPRKPMSSPT